jgi:transcriptional antiterminator NusG
MDEANKIEGAGQPLEEQPEQDAMERAEPTAAEESPAAVAEAPAEEGAETAEAEAEAAEAGEAAEEAETAEGEAPEAAGAAEPQPAEAAPKEKPARKKRAKAAEEPEAEAPLVPEPPRNPNMKWYIVHAYSGFERKVKESLESRIQAYNLQEKIGRVIIPTEAVTEVRGGKKYTVDRMFYPGYVLVEMDLTGFRAGGDGDQVWHLVKNTPRVTGFVGTGNDPTPLSDDEVNQIVYKVHTGRETPKLRVKFEKNEAVRITDGPFANFTGVVDEINDDRETLKVMVTIFGRATPVELEFGQVEKVA